ncbi:MAG: DNA mismatch repair protein MutS, partial [Lachnospiraceae bacterium]|nr:DNA mismatch repair protein MutS [Lachnospiraceae bacterium]
MMEIDETKLSPMMKEYLKTKREYPDCILFYRLGDFYEMFFDDAILVSKELNITLTGKLCGLDERAPMAGVPYHAVDSYLSKLVANGHKVAICEQMEDPALAKGLVRREVIRIVTPGTNLDTDYLDETKNNYLMTIVYMIDKFGFALSDISTGDFKVSEADSADKLLDEITMYSPSEIICNEAFLISGINIDNIRDKASVTTLDNSYFDEKESGEILSKQFEYQDLVPLEDYPCGIIAAAALIKYIKETQIDFSIDQIRHVKTYNSTSYMHIDRATRINLELTETIRDKNKKGSLLWVLDKTKTAIGARKLRQIVK